MCVVVVVVEGLDYILSCVKMFFVVEGLDYILSCDIRKCPTLGKKSWQIFKIKIGAIWGSTVTGKLPFPIIYCLLREEEEVSSSLSLSLSLNYCSFHLKILSSINNGTALKI